MVFVHHTRISDLQVNHFRENGQIYGFDFLVESVNNIKVNGENKTELFFFLFQTNTLFVLSI